MPAYSFRTIQKPSEGIYKEKGSKFLAFAFPVENEGDIKERLEGLKKKYFDARHHCYAWVLGADKSRSRGFDDGEPNHSAGDPILGQIRSKDLTDVLIVVVRYFGGVKLGVGGLINAYRTAAQDALQNAVIEERKLKKSFALNYPYESTAQVSRLIQEFKAIVVHQAFDENTKMIIEVDEERGDELHARLHVLKSSGVSIDFSD
jgi:uncharacterized YigZ family protein